MFWSYIICRRIWFRSTAHLLGKWTLINQICLVSNRMKEVWTEIDGSLLPLYVFHVHQMLGACWKRALLWFQKSERTEGCPLLIWVYLQHLRRFLFGRQTNNSALAYICLMIQCMRSIPGIPGISWGVLCQVLDFHAARCCNQLIITFTG